MHSIEFPKSIYSSYSTYVQTKSTLHFVNYKKRWIFILHNMSFKTERHIFWGSTRFEMNQFLLKYNFLWLFFKKKKKHSEF